MEADLEEAELQLLVFNNPEGTFATMRFQSWKKFVIIDFAGYPYCTDQAHHFGTFCLILSLNIIFLRNCMPLKDLLKSMWVIQCICMAL